MSNNNENKALAPFSCQFSPQVPELLQKLNSTIAISTYQAGKLVFISARDEDSLIQLPRNFNKAMGIAEEFENQNRQELEKMYIRNGSIYLTRKDVLLNKSFLNWLFRIGLGVSSISFWCLLCIEQSLSCK